MKSCNLELWCTPQELACTIADHENTWVLFESSLKMPFTGQFSYLALLPDEILENKDWNTISARASHDKERLENAWFGYLGYPMRHTIESLPHNITHILNFPDSWLAHFRLILQFDHENHVIQAHTKDDKALHFAQQLKPSVQNVIPPKVSSLHSNMSNTQYLQKVGVIKEAIHNGDLYQANLTRKFYGSFKEANPLALYCSLTKISPAPYSALIRIEDKWVISSSPEQFLSITNEGVITTRPIKGSLSNDASHKADELKTSEKDRAENLMIVDLMRNDLSRSAQAGSVNVESLFDVTSYKTIHHMSSTITANKLQNIGSIEAIKAAFPPGSMTGTPKIKAMELCSQLEIEERGVYSGIIGWVGGDGSVEFSVIIRTLLIEGNEFEFQVGGAIVADSVPQKELEETYAKARAIQQCLGISDEELRAI